MTNYIAYYRVSTKKQGLGLDAQKTAVNNFLNGVGGRLVGEFEEKESGKNDQRPALMAALNDCRRLGAKLIIAKLDRLSRNVSFVFELKESGIDFICCDIPELNTVSLGIYSTLAQHERELISERTKKALAELKAKGVKLGAPNPVITDEMRAKSAKALKEKAANNENNRRAMAFVKSLENQGLSLRKIAAKLNENGFRTSRGCEFTPVAVSILQKRLNG